ncbi:hypothetical protein PVK06_025028 [Gossypium arboreum]|uniref:Uncharacterized protein n=1 Tax=Gossypium arboreum TaxID=29729 RepID=A0ABR0PFQ2_GOSAR|nr:hypothetical protein PVK06_025028 [Gossypium arboreum]
MASYRKKSEIWTIKNYSGTHTCVVTGASQDHPSLDLDIIVDIILPMVKASPQIQISVLIADIRSLYYYTPMYYKVWVAKQKAMEKLHHGYNAFTVRSPQFPLIPDESMWSPESSEPFELVPNKDLHRIPKGPQILPDKE